MHIHNADVQSVVVALKITVESCR